ncbi:MAG: PIN domain-containing protein [Bacteroidota bacterium]
MSALIDSSVLVAFCVKKHPKHDTALQWFKKAKRENLKLYIAAHTLDEAYSVLTRAPFDPKIKADDARKMINTNILPFVTLITLDGSKYEKVMNQLADNELIGGIIYDSITIESANQAEVKQIITANTKDFARLNAVFKYEIEVIGI